MTAPRDFEPYAQGRHLYPHPDTVWPNPCAFREMEWVLRNGTPEQRAALVERERLMLASVLGAYWDVVTRPTISAQLPGLRRALLNPIDAAARECNGERSALAPKETPP